MNTQHHTSKTGVIDNEDFTLAEGLSAYGYLLDPRRDPNCWLWLKGMIADDLLPHARDVIYRRYGMTYTPPAPQIVERMGAPIRKQRTANRSSKSSQRRQAA